MITLFRLVGLQVLRARVLYLLIAMGIALQYGGLKLASFMNVQVNAKVVEMDPTYFTFLSLMLQLFVGSFVAVVFGLWFLPYLHQGPRAQLTFVMPVRKWMYPITYIAVMIPLIVLLGAITAIALSSVNGSIGTEWSSFIWCLLLQTLAFEVLMLGFGVGAVVMGPISSFFVGAIFLAALQGASILVKVKVLSPDSPSAFWRISSRLYALMPPVGDLPFALWEQMKSTSALPGAWLPWFAWMVILGALLVAQLRFRPHVR